MHQDFSLVEQVKTNQRKKETEVFVLCSCQDLLL